MEYMNHVTGSVVKVEKVVRKAYSRA
jgi:hypothetical protein